MVTGISEHGRVSIFDHELNLNRCITLIVSLIIPVRTVEDVLTLLLTRVYVSNDESPSSLNCTRLLSKARKARESNEV